jgi:hypothetical protein
MGDARALVANPNPLVQAGLEVPGLIEFQQRLGAVTGSFSLDPASVAAWALAGHAVLGAAHEAHAAHGEHEPQQDAQQHDAASSSHLSGEGKPCR